MVYFSILFNINYSIDIFPIEDILKNYLKLSSGVKSWQQYGNLSILLEFLYLKHILFSSNVNKINGSLITDGNKQSFIRNNNYANHFLNYYLKIIIFFIFLIHML